ncbi:MAG: mucin-binding protein [Enterococcus casseliflavus]
MKLIKILKSLSPMQSKRKQNIGNKDSQAKSIHYNYENGESAVEDHTDEVIFTRTITTNLATNQTTYSEWQAKDDDTTFDEVQSPEIKNYHADKTSIEEVTGLTADAKDHEVTVTYSPNMTESTETKEVKQTIHYVYEDGKEAAPDKVRHDHFYTHSDNE